ncbi:hypothetical protein BX589_102167 [Paraburkholderia fungorum]|nr:hypothetical protein BX589_102167 [Paraburkholderia fungorum]
MSKCLSIIDVLDTPDTLNFVIQKHLGDAHIGAFLTFERGADRISCGESRRTSDSLPFLTLRGCTYGIEAGRSKTTASPCHPN